MAEQTFRLEIIAPDRIFYSNDVQMVKYNTAAGQVGVYAGHIPMTQILAPGILTITEVNGEKMAALHTGFVEILPDRVTILAEAVEWPGDIDTERAARARSAAERMIASGVEGRELRRAELSLLRALVRLETAEYHSSQRC